MSDALLVLLAANLAAAVAVAVVMILRTPARAMFGARLAYGLWLLVPFAALGVLLPSRVVTVAVRAAAGPASIPAPIATPAGAALAAPGAAPFDPWPPALAIWVVGLVVTLAWMAWRQARFGRDAEAGLAGPAAVGVLRPRVVTPSDFARRYSAREQFVVLAHEQTHIARHDTRINALVTAARCVNWFNPALHVLARFLRIDQELACDAQVIARHPKVRRSYAEAMLKTQLAAQPLPMGCYWLPAGAHPLAQRIRLLSRAAPDPRQQMLGLTLLTALALAAVGSTWAAKPTRVQVIEMPAADALAAPAATMALSRIRTAAPTPLAPMSDRPRPAETPAHPTPPGLPLDPGVALAQAQADAQAAPSLARRDRARGAYEGGADPRPQPRPQPDPQPRRIYTAAARSSVEPGTAVRLVASTTDSEGRALMTDLTSFGSQHYYRTGTFIASGSRERLFTRVVQKGDRLWVTAGLDRQMTGDSSVTVEMRAGETRQAALPDGRLVTLTPIVRPETAEERAGARSALARVDSDIDRASRDAWRTFRDRCGTDAC